MKEKEKWKKKLKCWKFHKILTESSFPNSKISLHFKEVKDCSFIKFIIGQLKNGNNKQIKVN